MYRRSPGVSAVRRFKITPKASSSGAFTKLGLVFDEALDYASATPGQPSKYKVVVYQLRRRRWNNVKFWDRDTDFVADTLTAAENQAREYIQSKGWKQLPFTNDPELAIAQANAPAKA